MYARTRTSVDNNVISCVNGEGKKNETVNENGPSEDSRGTRTGRDDGRRMWDERGPNAAKDSVERKTEARAPTTSLRPARHRPRTSLGRSLLTGAAVAVPPTRGRAATAFSPVRRAPAAGRFSCRNSDAVTAAAADYVTVQGRRRRACHCRYATRRSRP